MATILLLVSPPRWRRQLEDILKDCYHILPPDSEYDLTSHFDLCIIDPKTLTRIKDAMPDRKKMVNGEFFPILLAASRKEISELGADALQVVDDVIARPVKAAELKTRVKALLRARQLSAELNQARAHGAKPEAEPSSTSELWYSNLFLNNRAMMLIIDPANGKIVDANPAACSFYGRDKESLLRLNIADINTLSPSAIREEMAKAENNRKNYFEFKHRLRDGTLRDVRVYSSPVQMKERNLLHSLIFDVSEEKRLDKELEEEKALSQSTLDSLPGVFYLYDENLEFLRWNKNFEYVTGYSGVEIGRMSPLDFFATDEKELLAARIQEVFDTGFSSVEAAFLTKDGSRIPYYFTGKKSTIAGQTCLLGVGIDFTELKQAKDELRVSEEKFFSIFQISPTPMTITRISDGMFLDVNGSFLNVFEFTREEVIGQTSTTLEIISQEERTKLIKAQIASGGLRNSELLARSKTGRPVHLLFSSKPMMIQNELCHISTLIDISERKQAEEALRESEVRLRLSTEMAHVAVWEYDFSTNSMARSHNHDLLYGLPWQEKWEFETFVEATHPEDRAFSSGIIHNSVGIGGPDNYSFDFRVIHPDRSIHWLSVTGQVVERDSAGQGVLVRGCLVDITERKTAEEEKDHLQKQLNQAQKLESVGRLAGGVAHDFNNVLSVMLGYAELVMDKIGADDPLREDLQEILSAGLRSRDITRQLMAFARKDIIDPQPLDLNSCVESMLKILRRLVGEDIHLAWMPGKGHLSVFMDPTQLDQILANLCVNARDAITDVGKIVIETGMLSFDEAYCADHIGFKPGSHIKLSISDNGCGMDKHILDNIFEPFFTTKERDKGTGLGLATVYGIVSQNNGFINIYSEPELGTTFNIYLPQHLQNGTVSPPQEVSGEIPSGKGEIVLVVEDEPSILKLTERILLKLKYHVLTASSPDEALKVAGDSDSPIDLLLTDVIMPQMNGRDLAEKLQALRTNIKVIFMSGYTADIISSKGVLNKGDHYIQKPFETKDIAVKVRAVLDSK